MKNKRRLALFFHHAFLVVLGMLAVSASVCQAAADGKIIQVPAGAYMAQVSFSDDVELTAGLPVFLNFFLLNPAQDNRNVQFTNVSAVILKDDVQVFKADLFKQRGESVGVMYIFPHDGTYSLHLTFNTSDHSTSTIVAEAVVPIVVHTQADVRANQSGALFGLVPNKELGAGLLGGILLSIVYARLSKIEFTNGR